jgi:hypothetical protein
MSRISSIVALSAPILQFKKTKALDMITISASWANALENCERCPV